MNIPYKSLLFTTLLMNATAVLTMERAVARAQDEALIEQLSQAVQEKDFDRYFALLDEQPLEQQKQLIHANLLNAERKIQKAIHFAAEQGNDEALEILLERGALIEDGCQPVPLLGSTQGPTPLLYAVRQDKLSTLLLLLKKGANKQAHNCGNTALHYAAKHNNVPAIIALIKDHGFDANIAPSWSFFDKSSFTTPLHTAAREGQLDAINALIECGARQDVVDSEGKTALHVADSIITMQLLITKHGFNPNALDIYGSTPLHYAMHVADCHAVKTLIEHGTRLDILDKKGLGILHHAAPANNGPVIALLLKEYNLNPNMQSKPTHNSITPLGIITRERARCCFAALALRSGGAHIPFQGQARKHAFNNFCFSHFTTDGDRQVLLESLINESLSAFDPNIVDTNHSTSLIKAARNGHFECVEFLLKDARTSPNIQDSDGKTALHHAVERCEVNSRVHLDCIKLLLKDKRTTINIQDKRGRTALHYAVDYLQRIHDGGTILPEICFELLRLQRTDVAVKDNQEKTPRDLISWLAPRLPCELIFRILELRKLFDLRKMRVHTYLSS